MKKITLTLALSCLLSTSALATTLSEALVNTYQHNPELTAAREKLKTIDEQMYQAISNFLPQISYSAKATRTQSDTESSSVLNSRTGVVSTQTTKVSPRTLSKEKTSGISITQNVFNGGRSMMAVQIAKYIIESGRADLVSAEQRIFLEAIEAYLKVIQTKQVLEINKENVTFYEHKFEAVKQEKEAGVKKSSDVATAEASKAAAFTKLAKASGDYDEALATYSKMVGIPADNLVLGESLIAIPSNQVEFLQSSLKNNPELISLAFKEKAANLEVKSNVAAMLPTVDVGTAFQKRWSYSDSSSTQPYINSKSIFAEISVPIYNRGMEYSNTRKSSAEAASLKYSLKNAKATISQNATQTWSRFTVAKESVKSAQEAVKAGLSALNGTQQEYAEGLNTFTELLNTQENLYQYQLSLAQAKQDLELSRYSLASLMGKLTAKEIALPTKIYNASANYDKIKARLVGF